MSKAPWGSDGAVPATFYSMAKAQEGLKSPGAAESYRASLAIKAKGGSSDPLVSDAKLRLGTR